jgi:hypothetical protein
MTTWEKLKALFSRSKLDREFDQELASHLDLAIDDGLRRGLGREAACGEASTRSSPCGTNSYFQSSIS